MVPEQRKCFLLEDPSLASLSTCLRSMDWQSLVFDLDEDKAILQTTPSCDLGIIHSHVLTDKIMSGLSSTIAQLPDVNWILVTSGETMQADCVKKFAYKNCCWFVTENISDSYSNANLKPTLRTLLEQGVEMRELQRSLPGTATATGISTNFLTGNSEKLNGLMSQVLKAASATIPVLITGESGTGKELLAKSIHQNSDRAEKPFIAINCGAIPDTLIQSELFGHERGSFTGADKRYIGRFEQAQHGTLFLDEIGELPLNQQVNLLRFLQEKTVERLGGSTSTHLDVRIISATNVNLEESVAKGKFREDLFYRLAVLQIEPPPLRHDNKNILFLAEHFLAQLSPKNTLPSKTFSPDAIAALSAYHWPGNVRELINKVQCAIVMCEGNCIGPEDLHLSPSVKKDEPRNIFNFTERQNKSLTEIKQSVETEAIIRALQENNHNISLASKKLRISRASMYRLMQKYELN